MLDALDRWAETHLDLAQASYKAAIKDRGTDAVVHVVLDEDGGHRLLILRPSYYVMNRNYHHVFPQAPGCFVLVVRHGAEIGFYQVPVSGERTKLRRGHVASRPAVPPDRSRGIAADPIHSPSFRFTV